jgi:hypothetical protein
MKVAIWLAIALAMGTATAAASSSTGVLTKVEYQQLRAMRAGTKASASGHHGSLKAALAVCRRAADVSPLLRASKARCEAQIYFGIADLNIVTAAVRCGKLKTADQAFNCLTPSFSALSSDSEALVRSVRQVDRAATARRFKSGCVAVLGAPKRGLALFVRFADDVRVLVASMQAQNLGLFNVVIKRVDSLEGSFKSVHAPSSLSVCPHQ